MENNNKPIPRAPENIPPASDLYRVNRAQIEHESNGTIQRIIWLTIAQSFFFNVYALVVTGKPQLPELAAKHAVLITLIPVAAMLSIVLTYVDVIGTMRYSHKLKNWYERLGRHLRDDAYYPPIQGTARDRVLSHIGPLLLPMVFFAAWAVLLGYGGFVGPDGLRQAQAGQGAATGGGQVQAGSGQGAAGGGGSGQNGAAPARAATGSAGQPAPGPSSAVPADRPPPGVPLPAEPVPRGEPLPPGPTVSGTIAPR